MSPSSKPLAVVSEVGPADRLDTLPAGIPDLTLGWEAIRWAHEWLVQPNGPRAGLPFRFTDRQMRFLLWWYALESDGSWVFSHGARRLAKGSGKSPFAAVHCLIELCAPVRLDRFDDRVEFGGCRGKPVDLPWVQIAATAESQTKNTMRMVRAFAPKGSRVVEEFGLDPGKTIYYRAPEGQLEVITSSFTAAEGAEPSFLVGDEPEHWKPNNGGAELAATIEDNLAKSGARMVETANSWEPGDGSVAEATWDAWVAQEEGRLQDAAGRILYDAVVAPADTDMSDYDSLRDALEWVYGDCDWKRTADGRLDVDPIIKRIWSPKSRPDDSRRKYLNQPVAAQDAWTTLQEWQVLADLDRVVADGEQVVLFFDGSKSRDATAVVGCCVSDGHMFVPMTPDGRRMVWEPGPDEEVDAHDVDLAVRSLSSRFDVVGFFADVREWESFVKVSWPDHWRTQPELLVHAQPAGKNPEMIAWDMRSHVKEFTLAAELTLAELEAGEFTHDGDPVLTRHVVNMRRRPNTHGVSVGKESPDSAKKIDAGVCMIGARMVRRLYLASGKTRRRPVVVRGHL